MRKRPLVDRFWEKVEKTEGCWLWKAGTRPNGYGEITCEVDGQWINKGAHRVAWELTFGPIPEGKLVCHSCDNRLCVNPSHLFLGTVSDNALDCVKKGGWPPQSGESNGAAKLTIVQVQEIRQLGGKLTQKEIAKKYNVSRENIGIILRRLNWKNI